MNDGSNAVFASVEEEERFRAARRFALRSVIPIIERQQEQLVVMGTGTLCTAYGAHFLVTATHVAKAFADGWAGLPTALAGSDIVESKVSIEHTRDEGYDVAVVRLESKFTKLLSAEHFNFLDVEPLIGVPHDGYSDYFLIGFPTKTMRIENGAIGGATLTIRADLYSGPTDIARRPVNKWDVLLMCGETDVTNMSGISGCPVWGMKRSVPGTVWSAERALRPIAVEHGVLPGRWIRASRWEIVDALIHSVLKR